MGGSLWRTSGAIVIAGTALSTVAGLLGGGGSPDRYAWTIANAAIALAIVLAALARLRAQATRSLKAMTDQVEAIGLGRFEGIPQSGFQELVPMSRALNVMVERLGHLADSREKRLQELHGQAETDALTGTLSRGAFVAQAQGEIDRQEKLGDSAQGGIGMVLVRVVDLNGLNTRHGRNQVDELLKAIATILQVRSMRWQSGHAIIARLNGPDFGVLLPDATPNTLEQWSRDLANASSRPHRDGLSDMDPSFQVGTTISFGMESPGAIMARADTALQLCERTRQAYAYATATNRTGSFSVAQWRNLIDEALSSGRVTARAWSRAISDSGDLFDEAGALLEMDSGDIVNAETLLQPALRTGRTPEIDLRVVELTLLNLRQCTGRCCVHVALASIQRPAFVARFRILLDEYADEKSRLLIALDTLGQVDTLPELQSFATMLKEHGIGIGVAGMGLDLNALCQAVALSVNFIKLAPELSRDLSATDGTARRAALGLMAAAAERSGIQLIASDVRSDEDRHWLKQSNVHWLTVALTADETTTSN